MPPKYYFDDIQRSEAWDRMRLGIPTASDFKKIITAGGKKSDSWKTYANTCVAERILKRQVDTQIANSFAMQRGEDLEADAVLEYETQTNSDTKLVSFVTTDDGLVGCSPDRLVGDDGLLEIKCPLPQTQINYLLDGDIDKDYKPQLQGQLFVTEREYVDIFAYHPELPFVIKRVERDEVYIRILEELLGNFNEYITDKIIELAPRFEALGQRRDGIDKLIDGGDVPAIGFN
jgi:YqaJ-like recombinase protein